MVGWCQALPRVAPRCRRLGPGGKLIRHIPKYILGRLTDEAKTGLQEGRSVGDTSVKATQVVEQPAIETAEFAVALSTTTPSKRPSFHLHHR